MIWLKAINCNTVAGKPIRIGILALQGGVQAHVQRFRQLGVNCEWVRDSDSLSRVDALILPGGESSSMLKLGNEALWDSIRSFADQHPVWGICAGLIILAKTVSNPRQESLGILDIDVTRNAYGCQNESFIDRLDFSPDMPMEYEGIFIRAPKITRCGRQAIVKAKRNQDVVMIEQGIHLGSTFHPELSEYSFLHDYFINKIKKRLYP